MDANRYTVGQDHTGSWWVIAPGGTTGYEFGPDHHDAEQATITCEWANERGAEPGVDSADPPPELVGGAGDTALERRLAEDRPKPWPVGTVWIDQDGREGVKRGSPGDLTLRDWDYPAPRSMWDGYAGE